MPDITTLTAGLVHFPLFLTKGKTCPATPPE